MPDADREKAIRDCMRKHSISRKAARVEIEQRRRQRREADPNEAAIQYYMRTYSSMTRAAATREVERQKRLAEFKAKPFRELVEIARHVHNVDPGLAREALLGVTTLMEANEELQRAEAFVRALQSKGLV